MVSQMSDLEIRLARDAADLRAAQRLRYDVFVRELGSDGEMVDHQAGLEADRFDPFCDHMLLLDQGQVVGVYRLMRSDQMAQAGQFYCDDEYDLTPLKNSGRRLLELGRSCLAKKYRGGSGVHLIWQRLAEYVLQHDIDVLFGVASFHGTDVQELAQPLSHLHYNHLAPENMRVRARQYQRMDLIPEGAVSRRDAMQKTPALIKAYLRLGGVIGDGAFVDETFNTTDVMLILDTDRLSAQAAKRYRT